MAIGTAWTVEFYVDENGNNPVLEFLESLDQETQAKIAASIEYLRIYNIRAHEPHVKHISDKVWELRVASKTNTYRVLYFMWTGKRIVLLHGFQKKTQKTPRSEIEIAQSRFADLTNRKNRK